MGKTIHPHTFRIDHHITLPLAFFAFVMNDFMSGHFIGSLRQSAEAKWIESVPVTAFRTSAEFIATGYVYFTR